MRLVPALLVFALGCSSDSTSGDDASTQDATTTDAPADVTKIDATADADAGGFDATIDVAIDAPDDVVIDVTEDVSTDASTIDAGATDGGKKNNCLGVFCIQGYQCCNLMSSQNYGTCQPSACLSCCQ